MLTNRKSKSPTVEIIAKAMIPVIILEDGKDLRERGIRSRRTADAGDCFAGKADSAIGFKADPELQTRIEELARKSTEGELTEDERAEYAGYVRANKFVAILRRQAQQIARSRHK